VVLRRVLGVLLILVGAIWFTQGIGVLKGSFMTGQGIWTVIGILCVFVGVLLLVFRRVPDVE
jgi:uncharacterized membrane protein YhiD involved in acid resistance